VASERLVSTVPQMDSELHALMEAGDFDALEPYNLRKREANRGAISECSHAVHTWDELLRLTKILPGRNELPALLFDLWGGWWFADNPDALAPAIEDAWSSSELPLNAAADDEWLELFEEAGFINHTVSDETARPREAMTLYRGATPATAARMSWTDRLETAQWFAGRFGGVLGRKVWTAHVEPSRLLAHFHDDDDDPREWEWVVDPRALTVEEYSP